MKIKTDLVYIKVRYIGSVGDLHGQKAECSTEREKFIHALIEIVFFEDLLCTGYNRPTDEVIHITVLCGFMVQSSSRYMN